jgi:hypothetical protein
MGVAMPENYDDLFTETKQPDVSATLQPQGSQLSKEDYAATMRAERDSLSELAGNAGIDIAGSSDKFQQYLDTLSRFERYSPQNTLLIYAQLPEATRLGSYESWQRAETPVTKGEKSISIFEPGKEYARGDGTVGVSMNIKKVFDISQTSAKNKLQPEASHDIRKLLKALMNSSPAPVKLVGSLSEGVGARYDEQSNVIEVARGLDGVSLFRCMSQEIAYATLDHQNTDTLTCNDKGFAAYAASYSICVKHGIDAKGYSFSDAPEYFGGMDGKEVRGEIKAIRDTVNDVAGRMAKELNPPLKEGKTQEARG